MLLSSLFSNSGTSISSFLFSLYFLFTHLMLKSLGNFCLFRFWKRTTWQQGCAVFSSFWIPLIRIKLWVTWNVQRFGSPSFGSLNMEMDALTASLSLRSCVFSTAASSNDYQWNIPDVQCCISDLPLIRPVQSSQSVAWCSSLWTHTIVYLPSVNPVLKLVLIPAAQRWSWCLKLIAIYGAGALWWGFASTAASRGGG